MRTVCKRILPVALLGWLAAGAAWAQQPNLIVIMSDDQGTNAVSAYGPGVGGAVSTPNIDRIASQGVKFSNAFGVDQICAPNRATLLTGKYGHRHGVLRNGDVFDGSQTTVVDLLRSAGYRTAIIGKWHLVSSPGDAGFDYWNVFAAGTISYQDPIFDRNGVVTPSTGYATDLLTLDAIQWIDANRARPGPFALFIMHKAPHAPYVPAGRHRSLQATDLAHPATFDDRWTGRATPAQLPKLRLRPNLLARWQSASYQELGKAPLPHGLSTAEEEDWIYQQYARDFLRTLAGLDESVGLVLDYLDMKNDEAGRLADHTVVIYTGDNGNLVGEHFSFAKQRPYEEVLRVPLLVRAPGAAPGSVVSQTVINTDLAPTLLDFAGATIPGDMQGRSLLELLSSSPPADWRTSFYFNHSQWDATSVVPYNGIRTSRYKLIHHYGTEWGGEPAWELIDLEMDPEERTNLYQDPEYAEVIAQLKTELVDWQLGLGITPTVTSCLGDMNYDGIFSGSDVSAAKRCIGLPAEGACAQADLDGNAYISANDVLRIGRAFGQSCPP
jgi:arylsulfatase A-like enzyme